MSQEQRWGHRTRPIEITIISLILASLPVINITGWFFFYPMNEGGEWKNILEVLSINFTPMVHGPMGAFYVSTIILLWVGFLILAWGIFNVKKWSFFAYIPLASANLVFSMFVYQGFTLVFWLREAFFINLVFFIPVFFILRKDILAPFFNPELKWWEQHKRVKKALSIYIPKGDKEQKLTTYDISADGLFAATKELDDFPLGREFKAHVQLEDISQNLEVHCKVVWQSEGDGNYPQGFGCTFVHLESLQHKTLEDYLKDLIKQGDKLHQR
jgi:Tfp pilus assembly protein PilZ